jgi:methylornithine synthase
MNPSVTSHKPLTAISTDNLSDVLGRALEGITPSMAETIKLLDLRDRHDLQLLYETASLIRERHFSKDIFLYGFVYFSTYCQNRCAFCYYNSENHKITRYRKTREEVIDLSMSLAKSGVNLIDLTMGEDPFYLGQNGWRRLVQLASDVRETVDLPLMVSPGVLPDNVLRRLVDMGVDWYACYQETHNRQLFRALRRGQDFDVRLNQRLFASRLGLLVEDGILLGAGETLWDRAFAIHKMLEHDMHQVRAMTLVPQEGTLLKDEVVGTEEEELKTIAVMRLVCQDRLIPASLDIEGSSGLSGRIRAGANVVTSIIPPHAGLAGVAQHDLDIENGKRTVGSVTRILDSMGLSTTSTSRYKDYLSSMRRGDKLG